MKFDQATQSYERWLAQQIPVVRRDLRAKHQLMAQAPFPFLRATFYRWMQLWPELCHQDTRAPRVLAVGDLHIENFGTWRDTDGRLVWGINDFDEAWDLPYTIDLVRLATSALLAREAEHLCVRPKEACAAILEGYTAAMRTGGEPFVLAECHSWMGAIAREQLREPQRYWEHLASFPGITKDKVPSDAWAALKEILPDHRAPCRIVLRVAGLGGRGHPRYVALLDWHGGAIAREAKQLTPSALAWLHNIASPKIYYGDIITRAVRMHDPLFRVSGNWLIRRLAPDCSRIELSALPKRRDEERLLYSMGWETANVHLGSKSAITRVRRDLAKRRPAWLCDSAKEMAAATIRDWKKWLK